MNISGNALKIKNAKGRLGHCPVVRSGVFRRGGLAAPESCRVIWGQGEPLCCPTGHRPAASIPGVRQAAPSWSRPQWCCAVNVSLECASETNAAGVVIKERLPHLHFLLLPSLCVASLPWRDAGPTGMGSPLHDPDPPGLSCPVQGGALLQSPKQGAERMFGQRASRWEQENPGEETRGQR